MVFFQIIGSVVVKFILVSSNRLRSRQGLMDPSVYLRPWLKNTRREQFRPMSNQNINQSITFVYHLLPKPTLPYMHVNLSHWYNLVHPFTEYPRTIRAVARTSRKYEEIMSASTNSPRGQTQYERQGADSSLLDCEKSRNRIKMSGQPLEEDATTVSRRTLGAEFDKILSRVGRLDITSHFERTENGRPPDDLYLFTLRCWAHTLISPKKN